MRSLVPHHHRKFIVADRQPQKTGVDRTLSTRQHPRVDLGRVDHGELPFEVRNRIAVSALARSCDALADPLNAVEIWARADRLGLTELFGVGGRAESALVACGEHHKLSSASFGNGGAAGQDGGRDGQGQGKRRRQEWGRGHTECS